MKSNNNLMIFGLLAAAGAGYYAYNQNKKQQTDTAPVSPIVPDQDSKRSIIPMPEFPMKRGSAGAKVKLLQQALVEMGGLPAMLINQAGGTDGKFGPGTEKALQAAGYSVVINQSTYEKITAKKSNGGSSNDGYKAVSDGLLPMPIYASIKKGLLDYSGDKAITYLPDNTAVGKFIQQADTMMLFEANINGKPYRYWMSKNDVKLHPASVFDQKMRAYAINQISSDTARKIIAYFS